MSKVNFFKRKSNDKGIGLLLFVLVLSLYIMLSILAIYLVFFNPLFYDYAFKKFAVIDELKISAKDLTLVRNNIILYFTFINNSLQTVVTRNGEQVNFYTELELMHMHDVRAILGVILVIFIFATLIFISVSYYYFKLRKNLFLKKKLGTALFSVPTFFLVLLPIIGAFMLIDFEKAFTFFHHLFFPQGNWEFDDSLMMTLLPTGLFNLGAMLIFSLMLFVSLSFLGSGIYLYLTAQKKIKKAKSS